MLPESVRRRQEGERFYVGDDEIVIWRYPVAGDSAYMVFEGRIQPTGGPPTLHTHASSEFFYTVEGELTVFTQQSDGSLDTISGPSGTTAFVPGETLHTYRNLSSHVARYLAVVSPGTDLAAFFNEVAVGPSEDRRTERSVVDIYSRYGTVTEIDPARSE